MSPPRRPAAERGLVMPPGRGIPRQPSVRPVRPEAPDPAPEPAPGARSSIEQAGGELAALTSTVRACQACGRSEEQRVLGSGYPRAPLMLLKDRPAPDDVRAGVAFAAEAEPLQRAFDRLRIPLAWAYGTTAVRCGDADATLDEVKACATHLLVEMEAVLPHVLVVFGPRALDAVRALDGRCGLVVPDEVSGGEPIRLRPGLEMVVTEPLPEGVSDKESKRRLWRDLQLLPRLLQP